MIILQTARTVIRDNIASDLDDLYELSSNPVVMRYMLSGVVGSRREAKKHLRQSIRESKKARRQKYYFAIMEKETNSYIGAIGYTVESDAGANGKAVKLGYFIKQQFWGKGYVTEAGRAVMDFAFTHDNVVKIEASCLEVNKASENVMKKLGFKKEGLLLKHQFHENEWKNRLIYGVIKEEWNTDKV